MKNKKKVLYISSVICFCIAFFLVMNIGVISGMPHEILFYGSTERIFAILLSIVGVILLGLAIIQPGPGATPKNVLENPVNPYYLFAAGIVLYVIVHFDIGMNFEGAKMLLYILVLFLMVPGIMGITSKLRKS
jgi:hypothetical protein